MIRDSKLKPWKCQVCGDYAKEGAITSKGFICKWCTERNYEVLATDGKYTD